MRRNCLHENGYVSQAHNILAAKTVGQVERIVPRFYAALEDCKADNQLTTVVEVEGKIVEQSVSILIDPGSTHHLDYS